MAEWTQDAKEYLEGYLLQTAALARSRNDDVDEIVDELRNHILIETEKEAGSVVSLDQLRKVLATLGTPEQVYGQEGMLEGIRKHGGVDSENGIKPELTPSPASLVTSDIIPQAPLSTPKKPKRGCATAIIITSIAIIMVVATAVGLFAFQYKKYMDCQMVSEELKATDTMRHLANAEQKYFEEKVSKGEVGEYGTIAQLTKNGQLPEEIVKELVRPGYIIELRVGHGMAFSSMEITSPPPVSMSTEQLERINKDPTPHFICITRFNKTLLPKSRDLRMDETGTIKQIDEEVNSGSWAKPPAVFKYGPVTR